MQAQRVRTSCFFSVVVLVDTEDYESGFQELESTIGGEQGGSGPISGVGLYYGVHLQQEGWSHFGGKCLLQSAHTPENDQSFFLAF